MDKIKIPDCEVCDGKKFTLSAGYYFCNECGTKSNFFQETEIDVDLEEESKSVNKKIKNKNVEVSLTSWEEFNFILLGFVNEIEKIDVNNHNFKLVTLQLWTAYLHEIEAAFHDHEDQLPKLFAIWNPSDAKILYGVDKPKTFRTIFKKKKKETKLKVNNNRTKGSTKRFLKMTEKRLSKMTSGNDMDNTVQNVTLDKIMTNKQNETAAQISFSTAGKKVLEKLGKDRTVKWCQLNELEKIHFVSNEILLSIIYCSLNITNSDIQLSDLLRFIEEGNLSYFDFKKFLPQSYSTNPILFHEKFPNLTKSFPVHSVMSVTVKSFVKTIPGLEDSMKKPNILKLCSRYCKDLCLSDDLIDFLELLIDKYPVESTAIYNFEGLAMGYIIFALKIIFGLDGVYENELYRTVEKINQKIDEFDLETPKFFQLHDWLKFIKYRSIIMKRFYYPLMCHLDNVNGKFSRYEHFSYINFLTTLKSDKTQENIEIDENEPEETKKAISARKDLGNLLQDLQINHESQFVDDSGKIPNIVFPPSMTPYKDYFEFVVQNYGEKLSLDLELANLKFCNTSMTNYLDPCELMKKLEELGMNIQLRDLRFNTNFFRYEIAKFKKKTPEKLYEVNFTDDTDEWINSTQKQLNEDQKVSMENTNTTTQPYYEKITKEYGINQMKEMDLHKLYYSLKEPKIPENTIVFAKPKYLLWHRFSEAYKMYDYYKKSLPENFCKIVEICACVINQNPKLVFQEISKIENKYFKVEHLKKNLKVESIN